MKNQKMLTFSFCLCPLGHVYTARNLKTVLVVIVPHTQGIFCQSDLSTNLFPITF